MVSKEIVFHHLKGLHLRPASELCKIALEYPCTITFQVKNKTANVKSVLSVLGACVRYEDNMKIYCDGEKEEEALERIVSFLLEKNNFD